MVRSLNHVWIQLQLFSQEAKSNMRFNFLAYGTVCSATCCPGRSVGLGDMHKCQGLIKKIELLINLTVNCNWLKSC